MDAIDLREIHRQLEELRIRCDYIEGYQRNAESGTTACSAAGGGIEQVKTARSAGREPWSDDLLIYIKSKLELWDVVSRNGHPRYRDAEIFVRLELQSVADFIEARRGDAGCVEPPAG